MTRKDITRYTRVLFSFYCSWLPASAAVTGCSVLIFRRWGAGALGGLLMLKILTGAIVVCIVNAYQRRRYYYYYNMGFSRQSLWIGALLIDFLVFTFSLLICRP